MSQCEDLGSSDRLLDFLSFFSREVKSLISSLHSFNIQMSFGRPGLQAEGWKNFPINFIQADARETHIGRLRCASGHQSWPCCLISSFVIERFSNTIASWSMLLFYLTNYLAWRRKKKSITGKLWGNLSNADAKGKRYSNVKNQADELVFILAIVIPVVNKG